MSLFNYDFVCQVADLIERQAKALEEAEKALAIFAKCYDDDKGSFFGRQCGAFFTASNTLANIRAARGEKDDG